MSFIFAKILFLSFVDGFLRMFQNRWENFEDNFSLYETWQGIIQYFFKEMFYLVECVSSIC